MTSADKPSRKSIFEEASKKLRQEFDSLKNLPHNGESGHEAEVILKKFLKAHLPKRYDTVSGFILDDEDQVSPQTDVIIVDAFNCPMLETFEDNMIVPSDNAAVVIEVKSNLRAKDIEDAAAKIAKVKQLKKTDLGGQEGPNIIATLGILFAFGSELSLETINKHYKVNIRKYGNYKNQSMGSHIDYIFVLDQGMTTLFVAFPERNEPPAPMILYPGSMPPQDLILLAGLVKYQSKTLDAFLRFLLAHLTHYFPRVAHPGFDLSPDEGTGLTGQGVSPLAAYSKDGDEEKAAQMMHDFELKIQSYIMK